ncbi:hypothetical protein NC652_028421 [Populus alba x Populus x berolinensis]|uniref:Secreted protein n=1 Tax=Populus alba x Populus x berolinensis TaxID=444605 RepID=A0AAD6Q5W7_9ROSI|nr:hypothetical protein NC652_028421 [Populus alba x Populus x berolinensis]KAJ6980289.1 hypothetical protein NC653_028184 [Populus alba x Populus x berolinensis]
MSSSHRDHGVFFLICYLSSGLCQSTVGVLHTNTKEDNVCIRCLQGNYNYSSELSPPQEMLAAMELELSNQFDQEA